MKLELQLQYFSYFSPIHIQTFIFSVCFAALLIYIPKIFPKSIDMQKYATFLGIFTLAAKIADSVFRYLYQNEPLPNVLLVHLCNFAVIFAALYLIFKTQMLFNITYFLSFGAAFALVLPGVRVYYHPVYVYIFMLTHVLEFVAVFYGFLYLNGKITRKGFRKSCIVLTGMFIYAAVYNYIFRSDKINAMFLNEYIAEFLSFIRPFFLYRVILISGMLSVMYLMYLPFREKGSA